MSYGSSALDEEKPLCSRRHALVAVLRDALYTVIAPCYNVYNAFRGLLTKESAPAQTQAASVGLERIVATSSTPDNVPDAIGLGMPISFGCGMTHAPRRGNRAISVANIVVGLDGPKVVEENVRVGEDS